MCRYLSDMWDEYIYDNDWCHLSFWPWIIPTWQVLCQMAYQSKLATWQLSVLSLLSLVIHPWDNRPAISQTHSLSCCPAQLASQGEEPRDNNGAFPLAATRLGSTWFLRLVVPKAEYYFSADSSVRGVEPKRWRHRMSHESDYFTRIKPNIKKTKTWHCEFTEVKKCLASHSDGLMTRWGLVAHERESLSGPWAEGSSRGKSGFGRNMNMIIHNITRLWDRLALSLSWGE